MDTAPSRPILRHRVPSAAMLVLAFVIWLTPVGTIQAVEVDRYKTLELVFDQATGTPANPFDTYLLRLEVTDPGGTTFQLDGFYDGNGQGGQTGNIWKARLCPYQEGTWSWRTVPGDAADAGLAGLGGQFRVTAGSDHGGITTDGRYFRFQDGSPTYLVGNFLDFTGGLKSTHVYMSETIGDADRNAILQRQRDFHNANKANVYIANKDDYSSASVTPWIGTATSNDKTRMDLARWNRYDDNILGFKDNGMLAELWFFADDSSFGGLSLADQQRLIRYSMARTSGFGHTAYVLALEWQEGFSATQINQLGTFAQAHNPWDRVLSVHSTSLSNWQYAGQDWPTFIATQAGNSAQPNVVNSYGLTIRSQDTLPHVDEEYGILNGASDGRLRDNLWANLTSGAAGGGTGSDLKALQRFFEQSGLPFQRMTPANSVVSGGGTSRFALSESLHHYLVYSTGGSFTLDLSGTGLEARWFNPRDPNAVLGAAFPVSAGSVYFTAPSDVNEDWVLWVTDGTNLNDPVIHPSGGAQLFQYVVPERLPGDCNWDGAVDDKDASILGAHWQQQGGANWLDGDFNGDGNVNDADAAILAAHWHEATPGTLPGDANVDGMVDDKDASILGAHWCQLGGAKWLDGDFNGDGNVNDADAAILAAHWGEGVGEGAVPEPGSVALLAGIAVMGMICLRRRKA